MNNMVKYNIFIFISTISRNIIHLFSTLILYEHGFSISDIILFYIIYYVIGLIISIISLFMSNIINSKYILIFSSITYVFSFYFLSIMNTNMFSLFLFSFFLAVSNYTYHPIRHLYALRVLVNIKKVSSILIFNYLAVILSSYLAPVIVNKMGMNLIIFVLIIISIISIIPLFFLKVETKKEIIRISFRNIKFRKILFFVFEQFKVIFLLLQPLYIYLFVNRDIEYIGIINAILGFSAIITIYLFSKTNNYKYFLINTIFCIVLLFKININNSNLLLIISLLEGIGIKVFEVVSSKNIYDYYNSDIVNYLIEVEFIFCLSSVIIFVFFYFINDLKIMLYICIIFIFLCGIINPKIDNYK